MSASTTVDSRCAIMMHVFLLSDWCAMARSSRKTSLSVTVSTALVASSHRRIGASLSNARAMAMRCFSPPDSFSPRSPTIVS
mmetsp:Transcript_58365/g.133941  ORF Transcript_58365/g.133941 Transcript_58365/m.133941 type:complete len:82 (-) Transcript_58365:1068-1313(-)